MKVGITTHYYGSKNYGGNLQAFALCEYINSTFSPNWSAEQVCICNAKSMKARVATTLLGLKKGLSALFRRRCYTGLAKRADSIKAFRENEIPHSATVYCDSTFAAAAREYDLLITGSDQVWHPNAMCGCYLLETGNVPVLKASYAASIAIDMLEAETQHRLSRSLESFSMISVRERDAVSVIQPLTKNQVSWVLDPVFLLSPERWRSLSSDAGFDLPSVPYLLCYFLGGDESQRKVVESYAREKNLAIVTLPFLNDDYRDCDDGFGDYLCYDMSPFQLVQAIDNAEEVFTDSFHATAFSLIFEKQFIVFDRSAGNSSMSSRVKSITRLFNGEHRFIEDPVWFGGHFKEVDFVDYAKANKAYLQLLSHSQDYIAEVISLAEKEAANVGKN